MGEWGKGGGIMSLPPLCHPCYLCHHGATAIAIIDATTIVCVVTATVVGTAVAPAAMCALDCLLAPSLDCHCWHSHCYHCCTI